MKSSLSQRIDRPIKMIDPHPVDNVYIYTLTAVDMFGVSAV